MYNFEEWTKDNAPTGIKLKRTQRVRWVYDESHNTVGSYGLATPEETKEVEDYEIKMLSDGVWVALGMILERQCRCGHWEQVDSLWGIVTEPGTDKLVEFYNGSGFTFPKKGKK